MKKTRTLLHTLVVIALIGPFLYSLMLALQSVPSVFDPNMWDSSYGITFLLVPLCAVVHLFVIIFVFHTIFRSKTKRYLIAAIAIAISSVTWMIIVNRFYAQGALFFGDMSGLINTLGFMGVGAGLALFVIQRIKV